MGRTARVIVVSEPPLEARTVNASQRRERHSNKGDKGSRRRNKEPPKISESK